MIEEHEVMKDQVTTGRTVVREAPGAVAIRQEHAAYPAQHQLPTAVRRVSWGAIFAGAIVATANQIAWAVLGTAIGLATLNPATEAAPAEGLGTFAGIWWFVTGLISLFLGGLVAGRLAGVPRRVDGLLNGLTVWALTTIAGVWLASSVVGGMFNMLGATATTAAETSAQGQNPADQLRSLLGEMGVSQAEIDRQVENLQAQVRQNVGAQDTEQLAQQTAETSAASATWVFVALVLGAAAAALGGWLCAPRHTIEHLSRRERYDHEPAMNRT